LCAPMIRRGRAAELSAGLVRWMQLGGGVVFVTATLPHDVGDRLVPLFEGVADSWRSVVRDRAVSAFREGLPFQFVRAAEVTHGANGWHPHLHLCLLFERPLGRDETKALYAVLFRAWCAAVVRKGWRPPGERYGLSVIRCSSGDVGRYISKVEGLAHELTRLDRKSSRSSGATEAPFALLRRAVGGDQAAEWAWREYERGTKGRRALTCSRGFRSLLGVVEATDEELCDPEREGGVQLLGELTADEADWLALRERGFEVFGEAVGAGTAEAWQAALEALRGSAPYWLSEAGWEWEAWRLDREREALAALERDRQADVVAELAGVQGELQLMGVF
jgi:hypothetical protein